MVYSLFLQVSLLDEDLTRSIEHFLGGVVAQGLDGIDNPLVYLVGKLVEIDVLVGLALVDHTEHVNGVLGQHRGQFNVHTTLTNGQAHLLGLQVDLSLAVGLVERDARHLGGRQGTLDKELGVAGVVDHVDVFVAEFAHDAVHAAALHTHAGSYGVDAVIETLNGNLGTLARHARHLADGYQAVVDLGHLGFEQTLQEVGTGAAEHDAGVVVLVLNLLHNSPHGLTLVVVVGRNLVAFQQVQFIALVVHEQDFALPHLINLAADNGAHLVLIFLIEGIMVQFENLGGQGLAQVQDGTAAELGEVYGLAHLFAHLIVGLNLLGVGQRDFLVLVLYLAIFHHHTVAVNLKVSLVGVYNHVEVLVAAKHFCQYVAETLFQNAHECRAVDVLCLFELLKGLKHAGTCRCFLCCHFLFLVYLNANRYFVDFTSSMENVLSTLTLIGRFLPSGTRFSCVVRVNTRPSTSFRTPVILWPSASTTSTLSPTWFTYCCSTLNGWPRPALPTSSS